MPVGAAVGVGSGGADPVSERGSEPSTRRRDRPRHLLVDPITCHAHGVCAELLPELVTLDEWGYPIVVDPVVGASVRAHARAAVRACPTLALRLVAPPR